MSRILKRPMFRKGGSPNQGIMTGLVERKQYAKGIDKEELKSNTELFESILRESSPKTKLPIGEFGLNLASGMTLTDALKTPYARFTKADDAREAAIGGGASKLAIAQALKEPKPQTTKAVRNISNKTLFNIPPGGEGLITNAQILSMPGNFKASDTRMISLPDGRNIPYDEYKIQNTREAKAKSLGTEYRILNGLVDRMQTALPKTKTGVVGYGFEVVEGFSDQIAQFAESFGVKENWKADNYDQRKIDTYLAKKGFTDSLEEGAAGSAIMKGAVINLAYALAKIAEPGNPKLSEGDIIRQLDRIKYGGSRNTFAKSLVELLEQEKVRARVTIEGFNLEPEDYLYKGKSKKVKSQTGTQSESADFNPLGIPENRLSP